MGKNIAIGLMSFMVLGALAAGAYFYVQDDEEAGVQEEQIALEANQIQVNSDGSFRPAKLVIDEGETVEWLLPSKFDSIVEAEAVKDLGRGACPDAQPVNLENEHAFTGPAVDHAAGLFTLNLRGPGFVEETVGADGECSNGEVNPFAVGNTTLCKVGEEHATMDQTWEDPALAGVFVRSEWKDIQTAPGMDDENFDFTTLDRELNAAVAHGKLVTINFVAGSKGTPDWLFDEGGVEPLYFEDMTNEGVDSKEEKATCGVPLTLGDPTDKEYQEHYFNLIRKAGEHIRSRSDWYRAVAYVKLSGANLHTEELDLPSRCIPGCICNSQVWAEAGYTPAGLEEFFAKQMDVWQEEFPGKPMIFALIQDGWPRVNNEGDYFNVDRESSGDGKLPGPFEQTERLLEMGGELYGDLFVTAHNGFQPQAEGRPNPWVKEVEELGRPTSYQTTNLKKVEDRIDLQGVMNLLWEDTNAFYLEIYEQVAWDARKNNGVLVPEVEVQEAGANSMMEWDALLTQRRNASEFGAGEIYPSSHSFTFDDAAGEEFYFYNPVSCANGDADQKYGVIEVRGNE